MARGKKNNNLSKLIDYAKKTFKNEKIDTSIDKLSKELKNIDPNIKNISNNASIIDNNNYENSNNQGVASIFEDYKNLMAKKVEVNSYLLDSLINLKNFATNFSYNKNRSQENSKDGTFITNDNKKYVNNSFIKNNNIKQNDFITNEKIEKNNQNSTVENFIKNGSPVTKTYTQLATQPYNFVTDKPGPFFKGFEEKNKELYLKNAVGELIKEISQSIQKKYDDRYGGVNIDVNKFLKDAIKFKETEKIDSNTYVKNEDIQNFSTNNNVKNEDVQNFSTQSNLKSFEKLLKSLTQLSNYTLEILNIKKDDSNEFKKINASIIELIGKDNEKNDEEYKSENIEDLLDQMKESNENTEGLKKNNKNESDETQENQKKGNEYLRKLLAIFERGRYQDLEDRLEGLKNRMKSAGDTKLPNLPSSGLGGFLSSLLTSIFLGPKGAALISSMIPATLGVAGKTLVTGIAGLLLGPKLFESIKAGFEGAEGEGFQAGVKDFINTFFKEDDIESTLGKSALAGFLLFRGPRGIIPGLMLGGAMTVLKSVLGGDVFSKEMEGDKSVVQKMLEDSLLGGLFGSVFGIPGILIGGSMNALYSVLTNKNTVISPVSIATGLIGGIAGLTGGALLGAKLGIIGGPVGMIAGALLGAALGIAFGSAILSDSQEDRAIKSLGLDAKRQLELEDKSQQGTITEEEQAELKTLRSNYTENMQKIRGEQEQAEVFDPSNVDAAFKTALVLDDGKQTNDVLKLMHQKETIPKFLKKFNDMTGRNIRNLGELYEYDANEDKLFLKEDNVFDMKTLTGERYKKSYPKGTSLNQVMGAKVAQDVLVSYKQLAMSMPDTIEKIFPTGQKRLNIEEQKPIMQEAMNDIVLKIPALKKGGVFNYPQLVVAGESPANNPEILFNRQQLQAMGQIFNMQKENTTIKDNQRMMPSMVAPTNNSQFIQNNNNSVQTINTTEIPPEPNSSVSFRDNLLF